MDFDTTGCIGDCIETYTGQLFNLLNPNPHQVRMADIIRPLSRICRFGGHTLRFLSVAEHCCHVCDLLKEEGHDQGVQLLGLLHDAAEAYVGDMVRPLKQHDEAYRRIEDKVQFAIDSHFGIIRTKEAKLEVKRADNMALRAESVAIGRSRGKNRDWGDVPEVSAAGVHCWNSETAANEYLNRLVMLA